VLGRDSCYFIVAWRNGVKHGHLMDRVQPNVVRRIYGCANLLRTGRTGLRIFFSVHYMNGMLTSHLETC